ncbi:MAG: SDR family oxidoreductase [Myxococcota bacterium]
MFQDQHVIVFAATGAIASGVALAFAQRGATVWLAGRDARVEALADDLRREAGDDRRVHSAVVDATQSEPVEALVSRVVRDAGRLDAVFNGIGAAPAELRYPRRTVDASVEDFLLPITHIVGSQFLTAKVAGRVMAERGRGAVVTLSATLSGMTAAHMAGISAACGAVEAMTRALAGDFGPHGVRVNCVRGSAMPETRTIRDTFAGQTELRGAPMPVVPSALGRPITVRETADTAAFLASDAASGIHGQVVTVCAGQFVGQG